MYYPSSTIPLRGKNFQIFMARFPLSIQSYYKLSKHSLILALTLNLLSFTLYIQPFPRKILLNSTRRNNFLYNVKL